jgi:uncharacterized membrane protein YeaQ/YmgE (transglycosylase-associated protein family)
MKTKSILGHLTVCGFFLFHLNLVFVPAAVRAADARVAMHDTQAKVVDTATAMTDAVKDAGRSAADSFESLWIQLEEGQLTNRSRDEITAWVIMGMLVGAVAGMFTSLNSSAAGRLGRLFLGLTGAFVGGLVVRLVRVDFGWGPVLVRYEELLFSLIGAVSLIIMARLIRFSATKKSAAR